MPAYSIHAAVVHIVFGLELQHLQNYADTLVLLSHVLESFERPNLDDFAGGLGCKDLLLLGERVDTFMLGGGRLINDYDFNQTRQGKDARAFLAHGNLDMVRKSIEHRCYLFAGKLRGLGDVG